MASGVAALPSLCWPRMHCQHAGNEMVCLACLDKCYAESYFLKLKTTSQ